jgi:hypothetical protein
MTIPITFRIIRAFVIFCLKNDNQFWLAPPSRSQVAKLAVPQEDHAAFGHVIPVCGKNHVGQNQRIIIIHHHWSSLVIIISRYIDHY